MGVVEVWASGFRVQGFGFGVRGLGVLALGGFRSSRVWGCGGGRCVDGWVGWWGGGVPPEKGHHHHHHHHHQHHASARKRNTRFVRMGVATGAQGTPPPPHHHHHSCARKGNSVPRPLRGKDGGGNRVQPELGVVKQVVRGGRL